MSKGDIFTARLDLKVDPQILADMDIEVSRLRLSKRMFGNRRPRHAAIVMVAVKHFLGLSADQRDAVYSKLIPELICQETIPNTPTATT
jgi:hypothetical protein